MDKSFMDKSFRHVGAIVVSIVSLLFANPAHTTELVIGEERIAPGIVIIFEGAVKDTIMPAQLHLPENQTHVHIEARVNWGEKNIPEGTPSGGFIPYLMLTAEIKNQRTGVSSFIDLVPHINLIDNFHYARNMSLPGKISDLYSVKFTMLPPTLHALALHKDWVDAYGSSLTEQQTFTYKDVRFEEIAKASRR